MEKVNKDKSMLKLVIKKMRLESEFKRAFLLNAFQIVWQKVPFFNGRRNEAFRHLTQTIRFFQVEIKFTLTSGMIVDF